MKKLAVITGASSGIGEACARLFAAEEWKVILVARRGHILNKIAEELNGLAIALDVTQSKPEDFKSIDRCDLLINCAGGAVGTESVEESNIADWSHMFNINVLGTLKVTQILLPALLECQGCIVNVTSTAAMEGYEGGAGYCAAKSAQRALTQSLKLEMKGKPIRITEILPGMVHTPEFSLNRFRGNLKKAESVYENIDRPLKADDVAKVILQIVSLPSHVNIDEIVIRPVAQRAQYALHRGKLNWFQKDN